MKAIVICSYIDKFTGEERAVNDIVEVNEKRARELLGDNKYKQCYIKLLNPEELENKEDKKANKKKGIK